MLEPGKLYRVEEELGLLLKNEDGHLRISRGELFLLLRILETSNNRNFAKLLVLHHGVLGILATQYAYYIKTVEK